MKKILLTLLLVVGSFAAQAQDYIDIKAYTSNGQSYNLIEGEEGLSDCIDSSLTAVGSTFRLLKKSDTVVGVGLVNAEGVYTELSEIANNSGLNFLFTLPGGLGFDKVNNEGFSTQIGQINGTSITF